MQNKIEELKRHIESLKKDLLALPSVAEKSDIEDLQDYLRISTELMKAVAALQVVQNIENETPDDSNTSKKNTASENQLAKPKKTELPEIGTMESVIQEKEPRIESAPKQSSSKASTIGTTELASKGIEVAEMLANNSINDLRNAFGLNERFYFTNELFKGDGQEFIRAINEFNHLTSFADAERLMRAKYQPEFGWTEENEVVEEFVTIIKRRYS